MCGGGATLCFWHMHCDVLCLLSWLPRPPHLPPSLHIHYVMHIVLEAAKAPCRSHPSPPAASPRVYHIYDAAVVPALSPCAGPSRRRLHAIPRRLDQLQQQLGGHPLGRGPGCPRQVAAGGSRGVGSCLCATTAPSHACGEQLQQITPTARSCNSKHSSVNASELTLRATDNAFPSYFPSSPSAPY